MFPVGIEPVVSDRSIYLKCSLMLLWSVGAEGTHALVIGGLRISGLLYVDYIVLLCFASCGLHKKIGFFQKYFNR
jgi:hypothetical protein